MEGADRKKLKIRQGGGVEKNFESARVGVKKYLKSASPSPIDDAPHFKTRHRSVKTFVLVLLVGISKWNFPHLESTFPPTISELINIHEVAARPITAQEVCIGFWYTRRCQRWRPLISAFWLGLSDKIWLFINHYKCINRWKRTEKTIFMMLKCCITSLMTKNICGRGAMHRHSYRGLAHCPKFAAVFIYR